MDLQLNTRGSLTCSVKHAEEKKKDTQKNYFHLQVIANMMEE